MSARQQMPRRLVLGVGPTADASGAEAATEPVLARAASLLRALQSPPPRLSSSARTRIVARLTAREGAEATAQTRGQRLFWPGVVVEARSTCSSRAWSCRPATARALGLAPARRLLVHFWRPDAPSAYAAPPRHAAETWCSGTPPREAPETMPAPHEELADPLSVPTERVAKRGTLALARPRAATRTREAAASGAPSEDPVVAESRLLADALTALRQRRDPELALRALDDYERRFPAGALAPEAAAARIDALLALGRRAQALARLETLPLERLPRGTELRVLRGELRAGRGALGAALDDFTAVLSAPNVSAASLGRALYGRGSCRSRLGDVPGARADLTEYLRRFPSGPFAEPARRALRD